MVAPIARHGTAKSVRSIQRLKSASACRCTRSTLDRDDARAIPTRTPIRYTPTFVLIENGEELGRIEGYPGDAFFWGLLDRLLQKLPPAPTKGVTSADTLPEKPVEGIRMSSACCTAPSADGAKAGNAPPP